MYGTQEAFATYCSVGGYDLTGIDATAQTAALVRASTFVDGLGYRDTGRGVQSPLWPGRPAVAGQSAEWPRTGASDVYGAEFGDADIPQRVIDATYEVAFHDLSGGDINRALSPDQLVTREKFDVVEFQYAGGDGKMVDTRPVLPAVMSLLAPLIGGGRYGITMVVS
ncbi:MAG: DnaT-like ssDNA-binding protein [Pseudomonadota bacterium]